jgi:antitoxin FitA
MGSLLQIRNVPDEDRRKLKARAAESGKSLNAFLLDLIAREVSRPTVNEVLRRAERRAERASGSAVDALSDARAERDRELGTQ